MKVSLKPKDNPALDTSFSWNGSFSTAQSTDDSFLYSTNKLDIVTARSLQEHCGGFFVKIDHYNEQGVDKVMIIPDYSKVFLQII